MEKTKKTREKPKIIGIKDNRIVCHFTTAKNITEARFIDDLNCDDYVKITKEDLKFLLGNSNDMIVGAINQREELNKLALEVAESMTSGSLTPELKKRVNDIVEGKR